MISRIVVLGGGSAGFIAALTVAAKLPNVKVVVVRSSEIGTIMVGEGTIPNVLRHLHGAAEIPPAKFHAAVKPTWKLGIQFHWGKADHFNFTFQNSLDGRLRYAKPGEIDSELPMPVGFYSDDSMGHLNLDSTLMDGDLAFARTQNGLPMVTGNAAYHLENTHLAGFLEEYAREKGIEIIDDTVSEVMQDEGGVSELKLVSGRTEKADLFVDCSGFRSVLVRGALEEPLVDFSKSLFCDRAVVGGWKRTDEPILPYTVSETMNSGWSWLIGHDDVVNRGYVYSSAFISDDEAEKEFREKNPKVEDTRIVKFLSGRTRNSWVKNVVAIGNAAGFVEPLEATALAVICHTSSQLVNVLRDTGCAPDQTDVRRFNESTGGMWDQIAGFLALHYKFNGRLETPFWRECREKTDLGNAAEVAHYYAEKGPVMIWKDRFIKPDNLFGWDGYFTILKGCGAPCARSYNTSEHERNIWNAYQDSLKQIAANGFTVEESSKILRAPQWRWDTRMYAEP